ncbi:NADH-dependent D-xylose reductase [Symbiodinium microadriaticum]|uniref:NADH-dependent D-xylose reductase n=1 Tax=Symbiodinium microadriaticum TaxID=2951 RepID=A0A1Q9ESI8_SYMMI|nr:NADH-dependent D-xylose reductase [Symbiodinium microadriaticum]
MNDDISLAASSAVDSDFDHLLAVSEGQGSVNVNIGSDDDMASSCDNDFVSLQRSSEEMHGVMAGVSYQTQGPAARMDGPPFASTNVMFDEQPTSKVARQWMGIEMYRASIKYIEPSEGETGKVSLALACDGRFRPATIDHQRFELINSKHSCALPSEATSWPVVNQIESHVYLQQPGLVEFCKAHGIGVTAFSPLGAKSYMNIGLATADEDCFLEPTLQSIATAHGKTVGQVALRFQVQRGCSVVPKSQSNDRLKENLDILGFELSAEEMQAIEKLERNRRFNDPAVFARGWGAPGSSIALVGCPIYA